MNTSSDLHQVAHHLIDTLPIPPMEAYVLLKELLETSGGRGNRLRRAHNCIQRGAESLQLAEKSVPFSQACSSSLDARCHRRPRTQQEIRCILARMMRLCPELRNKQVRSIRTEDCRRWLDTCFSTPRQWNKGRVILSGVLSYATRQGWCRQNTAALLTPLPFRERRIVPLSLYETRKLLATARQLYAGACLPACALMLYAGLRPQEIRRLTWEHINLKAGVVNISPEHSKTGGFRQVDIAPVLSELLTPYYPMRRKIRRICPPNWEKKWREVRRQSGILKKTGWVQDVLRHTFASYHLAYFRNKPLLQAQMGHCGSRLLESRYVDMGNITPSTGKRFWEGVEREKMGSGAVKPSGLSRPSAAQTLLGGNPSTARAEGAASTPAG